MMRFASVFTLLLCSLPIIADEPNTRYGLGDPGKLQKLSVETGRSVDGKVPLAGRSAWQQLLVNGHYSSGQVRDLTRSVKFNVKPENIVKVDKTGLVTPLGEGEATIEVQSENGVNATTTVKVTNLVHDVPVNFPNQIVPILTKFGCNAGGCHGKSGGQNGFALSLLGFEPQEDFEYIVMEARGRRVFPAAPNNSLLLLKAAGQMGHGGGRLIDADSPYYAVMRRWIEQGMPYSQPDDPVVTRIEVLPHERQLDHFSTQQLIVLAHFSDGTVGDVTRMTQFESNFKELAEVSDSGLVRTFDHPGTVAIMARYQSHVSVFRGVIPLGVKLDTIPKSKNFIDDLVFGNLEKLGLPPSELCDDATFIRRVTVDIAGRLPTLAETQTFLKDKKADRYERLVDRLLNHQDYAYYFAGKWSAVLRNRRTSTSEDPRGTFAFHQWIVENLHKNKPYDRFVRELLTATGKEVSNPPVTWYREVDEIGEQVEDTAQLFLGQRIGCAKCHHHPFEKWSQDDYHGYAAFFSRLKVNNTQRQQIKNNTPLPKLTLAVSHTSGTAQAVNPRTKLPVPPTGLGSKSLKLDPGEDPRVHLARWMTDKNNPYFAKTLVNRYWKHFMGRGLVEPEDDMRVTNPPSNPALLNALAKHFTEKGYDLKDLVRTICTSNAYRLSSTPNEHNKSDIQNFSRFLPRRLTAEVLLDSIDIITQSQTRFSGMPDGTKAVQLPDNQFNSYFLSVFGRPDNASACECERTGDATLAQSLHILNSKEILQKVSRGRTQTLARDKRSNVEKLTELYMIALSREPSSKELQVLQAHIESRDVQQAYENIFWAMINTKEFLFNH